MMDNHVTVLPDGSAFATASWPLPKTHWLYAEGHNVPPMPLRMGTDNPERQAMNQKVWAAAKYAVRAATMNGKEPDFDPDALCQNMVVGLLGYHTADGLSSDSWENPPQGERKAFEAWISKPPFEQSVRRYSDNPQTAAWPGNYREYNVQLAWCAWEARAAHQRPYRGVQHAGCNYLTACGSVCNKCGQAT